MSGPPIAVYLVPVYIIIFCALVNYIAIRSSSTLRSRLSRSNKIRYLVPYPLILIGLPPVAGGTLGGGTGRETTQRVSGPTTFFSTLRPSTQTRSPSSSPSQQPQGGQSSLSRWVHNRTRSHSVLPAGPTHDGSGRTGSDDPLTDLMARHLGRTGTPGVTPSVGGSAAATRVGRRGTTSTSTPGAATTTTPTTRNTAGRVITRGGRRWGRTGSQRSTQTLPLYEEQAGEEDVVLIRKRESLREAGRGDEQDIVEGQTDDEGDVEEEQDDESLERQDEASREVTPTEDNVDVDDDQDQRLHSISLDRTRTRASSVSTSDIPDRGWGEAPSYDTAVPPPRFDFDVDPESRPVGVTPSSLGGFRAFVGRLTGGRAEQHRRGFSAGSTGQDDDRAGLMRMSTAGTATVGRSRGWSNASSVGTRNVSDSSTPGMISQVSLLSTTNNAQPMTRFSSRLSSFGAATPTSASSSVINLGGTISAPLPGTLIRSSFDAPRAGFSAKQVEFLSSTDSLGKYGVRVDENGNPIAPTRARGSSVGSTARPSVDEATGTGWRALAREEHAAGGSGTASVPAPLHIVVPPTVPRPELEIEVVPPTPILTS